jgi:hypothetical protein
MATEPSAVTVRFEACLTFRADRFDEEIFWCVTCGHDLDGHGLPDDDLLDHSLVEHLLARRAS